MWSLFLSLSVLFILSLSSSYCKERGHSRGVMLEGVGGFVLGAGESSFTG